MTVNLGLKGVKRCGNTRKQNSQALDADALHFRTDIWSSSVVILGLIAVKMAQGFPRWEILRKADSVAALAVAGIVIYVNIELGIRTMQGLLNQAPKEIPEQIANTVKAIPGIDGCHRVRVRTSGAGLFIDLHVKVAPNQSLKEAHVLAQKAAEAIRRLAPKSDVTVHAEPNQKTARPVEEGKP